MQKITFLTVGRIKMPWIVDGQRHFLSRLEHSIDLHCLEISPSKQIDPEKQRLEECAELERRLTKLDADVWLLDERGKAMTSVQFSKILEHARDRGRALAFVLGGAYGFTDAFRKEHPRLLQLSAMTFPHEFCQLVFLEQIYRAVEIAKGSGYHH